MKTLLTLLFISLPCWLVLISAMPLPSFEVLFLDDFNYGGPAPDAGKWTDRDVYINFHFPGHSPTPGVATFDNYDESWEKHNLNLKKGDELTSVPIDLSAYGAADEVQLYYMLQIDGLGDGPDGTSSRGDKFIIEFLDRDGQWLPQHIFQMSNSYQINSCSFGPFDEYILAVEDDIFFHPVFQFRFRVENIDVVYFDPWHLDYVKLTAKEEKPNNTSDVSFTQLPGSILENYTAMPWRHFYDLANQTVFAHELMSSFKVGFYNHDGMSRTIDDSRLNIYDGATLLGRSCPLVNGGQSNIPSHTTSLISNPYIINCQQDLIDDIVANYDGLEESVLLTTVYSFSVVNGEANSPLELAQMVAANNEVQRETVFGDYFSYDDGSAEKYFNNISNDQVAIKYTANVDDQIAGMMLHYVEDGQSGDIDLIVWIGDLDDSPDYYIGDISPEYTNPYTGFSYYIFRDANKVPIPIDVNVGQNFYIGFTNATSGAVAKIGVDVNNRAYGCQFAVKGSSASPLNECGAIMARPLMGDRVLNKYEIEHSFYNTQKDGQICADIDFGITFDITTATSFPLSNNPVFFELQIYDSNGNRILLAREPNLFPTSPGTYKFSKPLNLSAGTYDFRVIIDGDCGGGLYEEEFTVHPSMAIPSLMAVCNNGPVAWPTHVNSGVYQGFTVESPSESCTISQSTASVPIYFNVEYIGAESVYLFPGFQAMRRADFLARIEPGCFIEEEMLAEDPGKETEERSFTSSQMRTAPITVFPNPFNDQFTTSFQLNEDSPISLSLYNAQGQRLRLLLDQTPYQQGSYQLSFDRGDLPPGIYFLELDSKQGKQVQKLIKLAL